MLWTAKIDDARRSGVGVAKSRRELGRGPTHGTGSNARFARALTRTTLRP